MVLRRVSRLLVCSASSIAFSFFALGCGGSSSSHSVQLQIVSPPQDTQYAPESVIDFELNPVNFTLAVPNTHRTLSSLQLRHEGEDHSEDAVMAGETEMEVDMTMDSSMDTDATMNMDLEAVMETAQDADHDHSDATLNPDAREGHYHVYLDDRSGTDSHLTLWERVGSFQLTKDVSCGHHTLRFELRDNDHIPVGVEAVLFFEVLC